MKLGVVLISTILSEISTAELTDDCPFQASTLHLGLECGGRAEIHVIVRGPTGNMRNMDNMINIK
jgi:hypothetical protein